MSSQNDNVDLTILLPTYNEALTIQNMLEAIRTNIPDETIYEIIIVDDDSPDGTNEIANSYFEKLENIIKHNVHVRKNKRGLSSAVIDGMKIACGKYVLVMDSDFSHPPEMIRKMYSKITNDDLAFPHCFLLLAFVCFFKRAGELSVPTRFLRCPAGRIVR